MGGRVSQIPQTSEGSPSSTVAATVAIGAITAFPVTGVAGSRFHVAVSIADIRCGMAVGVSEVGKPSSRQTVLAETGSRGTLTGLPDG